MDLGHGQGNALLAAALAYQFKEVRGVELLQSVFETSVSLKESY